MATSQDQAALEIVKRLDLQPHPEGGFYKETYRCPSSVTLPNGKQRSLATSIYFMLKAGAFSQWRKLPSDEIWYFHGGCSMTIHEIDPNGVLKSTKLGSPQQEGTVPQHLVQAGHWAASVAGPESYVIIGCVVAPGFDFEDFQLGDEEMLGKMFPNHKEFIKKFIH